MSEHYGDACPGSTVFVRVAGLEAFHAVITGKGYGYLKPGMERTFHQLQQVEVTAPFGNRIRFDESVAKHGA